MQIKPIKLAGIAVALVLYAACLAPAAGGFRSPESLIRNVYAHYGSGAAELSRGLPRDAETAARFFDPALGRAWLAPRRAPYDFMVQGTSWKLGAVSIATLRKQFDKTHMSVSFGNAGRAVRLNFIVVNGPDGWVIADVESPHDSLRMFLAQHRNQASSGKPEAAAMVTNNATAEYPENFAAAARDESRATFPCSRRRTSMLRINVAGLLPVTASGGPGMKTILVPTQNIAAMPSALGLAVLLARRTGAYIEGFPLRVAIPPYIAAELTAGFTMAAYTEQRDEETTGLRRQFEAFMQEHGIPLAGAGVAPPSFGWISVAPEDEGFIGSHGRAFDITVISRLGGDSTSLHQRAIETALFESGRPVLLAPPQAPAQIATNVMIHWNGSTEQARANAFAMPLLRLADRVSVLTVVGGQEVPGPSPDDVLRQLQHNGISAKPIRVKIGDRDTGEAVLEAAKAEGCDLLVKGAFTRNRLRQMIFGGATSHIMEHADLPVLMAH